MLTRSGFINVNESLHFNIRHPDRSHGKSKIAYNKNGSSSSILILDFAILIRLQIYRN